MIRRQVIELYRDFMKVIKQAPKHEQVAMREWVRQDFKKNKGLADEVDVAV